MAPKRQTLDSLGTRVRARTYADSYVPKPYVGGVASDVVPNHPNRKRESVEEMQVLATQKAHEILRTSPAKQTQLSKPIHPATQLRSAQSTKPNQANKIVRPAYPKNIPIVSPKNSAEDSKSDPPVLADLVRDIQKVEHAKSDMPNPFGGKGGSLSRTLQSMFASKRSIAMSAMSFLLLIGGSVALVSAFTTNHAVNTQVKALSEKASQITDDEVVDSDTGVPSEDKPPEAVVNSYAPPADEPRYIYIPKIKNAKTRVLKMGVGKDGAIQTPRTTWDTGWFSGSSKPGDAVGSSLIVGHVSGLTGVGVFYNLYRLTDGDEVIVEMGDGVKYTYKVVGKEEVPADSIDMNKYLVSKDIDKPGLTIMTCAGEFNPVTQTFDNRLAVFAVREK